MEPVTWGFIGTIAGTIVGASASIITTLITARNSRKLQQDAESHERSERARDFQRNNLLEIQEELLIGMRLISSAHIEDLESFKKSENENRRSLLSQELDKDLLVSSKNLTKLSERTADQSLRESIKILRSEMTTVLMAKTENESFASLQRASATFENTMEKLGVVLRSSY